MLTLFLLTVLIYHRCFRRYDADPEPELGLPAKRLTFLSGPNRLQGYLCGTGDTTPAIINPATDGTNAILPGTGLSPSGDGILIASSFE